MRETAVACSKSVAVARVPSEAASIVDNPLQRSIPRITVDGPLVRPSPMSHYMATHLPPTRSIAVAHRGSVSGLSSKSVAVARVPSEADSIVDNPL